MFGFPFSGMIFGVFEYILVLRRMLPGGRITIFDFYFGELICRVFEFRHLLLRQVTIFSVVRALRAAQILKNIVFPFSEGPAGGGNLQRTIVVCFLGHLPSSKTPSF